MDKDQKEFHRSRRKEFSRLIGKDSIAIIFGSTHQSKSYDGDFDFKQYKNFYYLTGFTEPNAALVMAPSGMQLKIEEKQRKANEVLYVQKKDSLMETWTGRRLGYNKVKQELGIEEGKINFDIKTALGSKFLATYRKLYVNLSELIKLNGEMNELVTQFLNNLNIISANVEVIDASFLLGKMRSVKVPYEIKMIKKACDISAESYNQTLKMIRPGLNEYQVQSSLEFNYKFNGSRENAYYPIVAGGENACILHYDSNDQVLKNGDLLLVDSGAEYNYYCSDITRTFPVNGKFTKEQKIIYDIVLKANKECIKKIRPGVRYTELKDLSDRVLADGLFKAGLLKNKKDIKTYSLHGVGHHIGLDTHDAVTSGKTLSEDNDKLKPGNVLTIEPGLYFPFNTKGIPVKFQGMGVRIEDDVLVTRNGNENLTGAVPKETADIEKAMQ
ncbi:MAG: aminopeptidase P family protein [Ignavibacteria bacterium]